MLWGETNYFGYTNDTTLITRNKEYLKHILFKVKKEFEKWSTIYSLKKFVSIQCMQVEKELK